MSNRILYLILFLSTYNLGFSQDKLQELKPIIENYLETDLDSAEKYSEELLHSGFTNLNKEEEHHGLNYLAHIEYRRGNRMGALEFFIESLEIRYKHGKITETANTLNWIGRIHHEQTDYDKALEYYFLSLQKLQKEDPDSSYLLPTLNNITYLYLDIGDNEKMLEYNNQSLIISKLTNDNLEYANACNLRGIYFQNLQTLDSAEFYYKKALAFYSEINFTHKIAHQYNNLGIIYFLNGKMKDSYVLKDSHSKANYNMGDARFMAADTASKPMLVVDGGVTMDALAFRNTSPVTHYTPEQLGMSVRGTPFENGSRGDTSEGLGSPDEYGNEPPNNAYPVTFDKGTSSSMDHGLYLAEDNLVSKLNTGIIGMVSKYWGIGLIIGAIGYSGYYLGSRR